MNPDAVAYLMSARNYAAGELSLAVNGYWGPLLSWLIVPFLGVSDDPRVAARIAMWLSGLVFTLAGGFALDALRVPRRANLLGRWLVALAAVAWSVPQVTPDLLQAGLFVAGAAFLLRPDWRRRTRTQLLAGALLGAAYLTKAVALPAGVVLVALVVAWLVLPRRDRLRETCLAGARTLAVLFALALPWIGVLSIHYGKPTFSTTGAIAHSVVGPADVHRWYPTFTTLHEPPEGRISSWEDPTYLEYERWSPFASAGFLRHQVRVVFHNMSAVVGFLTRLDVLALGLGCLFVAALGRGNWFVATRRRPWRMALLPTLLAVGPYLPVFAYSERYYWVAYPFLLAAALGVASETVRSPWVRRAALLTVGLSFGVGLVSWDIPGWPHSVAPRDGLLRALMQPGPTPASRGERLAARFAELGIEGSVASNDRLGLYVAFFSGRPSHGSSDTREVQPWIDCGAELVLLRGEADLADGLATSGAFDDLTEDTVASDERFAGLRVLRRRR